MLKRQTPAFGMMRPTVVLFLLALVALSGCLSDDEAPERQHLDSFSEDALGFDAQDGPSGAPASGTPASHGEPDVNEGRMETRQESLYWYATQMITIDNDFGGANAGDVLVSFAPGSLEVRPSPDGDYHYRIELVGIGGTEAEAETALEQIRWSHDDSLDGGTLHLQTIIERDGNRGISCTGIGPLTRCTGQSWRANVIAELPDSPAYAMAFDVTSADITATGFHGSQFLVDATSGDMQFSDLSFAGFGTSLTSGDIQLDTIKAGTMDIRGTSSDVSASNLEAQDLSIDVSSGDVSIRNIAAASARIDGTSSDIGIEGGIIDNLEVGTSSGDQFYDLRIHNVRLDGTSSTVHARFEPTASGDVMVDTSSGDVDLEFTTGSRHGYDVMAEVTSGDIDVRVADSDGASGTEDRVRATTDGFLARAIQTTVNVETTSGDITIEA